MVIIVKTDVIKYLPTTFSEANKTNKSKQSNTLSPIYSESILNTFNNDYGGSSFGGSIYDF